MPYAGDRETALARKRARERQRRAETNEDYEIQRKRKMKQLREAFERNEEQRSKGLTVRGLEPKPKKSTLEKYGIEVFLQDTAMFDLNTQTNKNEFIQVRRPQWKENFNPEEHQQRSEGERQRAGEPSGVPESVEQLVRVKKALDETEIEVKDETKLKRWRDFKNQVQESGCENIVTWINSGECIEYINNKTAARNTKMGYLKSFYFIVVKHELLPGVTDEAKVKLTDASKDSIDTVKYHQLNQEEIEDIQKIKPYSQYLDELVKDDYDELSDELVLMRVYDELTLRDDYDDIVVYSESPPDTPGDESYYVVSTGTIHFNGFKKTGTQSDPNLKLYKPKYFAHKFSAGLVDTLKRYIAKHGGDRLFVKSPRRIAQAVGTNFQTMRKSKVREVYDDENFTLEQRKKLADDMAHSWATQLIYAGRTTRSGRKYA